MKLYIKNMVCARCISAVERELRDLSLSPTKVELGIAHFDVELVDSQVAQINNSLVGLGFELLQNKKSQVIEQVKRLLIKKLQQGNLEKHFSIAKYLAEELKKEYTNISKLFSENENLTIEQYFILLKLEKAKELISYGEHTLCDIAELMGYSSVQHLSSQFKRVIGISAKDYKKKNYIGRKAIDEVL